MENDEFGLDEVMTAIKSSEKKRDEVRKDIANNDKDFFDDLMEWIETDDSKETIRKNVSIIKSSIQKKYEQILYYYENSMHKPVDPEKAYIYDIEIMYESCIPNISKWTSDHPIRIVTVKIAKDDLNQTIEKIKEDRKISKEESKKMKDKAQKDLKDARDVQEEIDYISFDAANAYFHAKFDAKINKDLFFKYIRSTEVDD